MAKMLDRHPVAAGRENMSYAYGILYWDHAMQFVPVGTAEYRESYLEALSEGFRVGANKPLSAYAVAEAKIRPDHFFDGLANPSRIVTLPNGEKVETPPSTILWWVDEHTFIGALQIYHSLTGAMVAAYGGHISYGIRPSRRNQGHAKRMLSASLPVAAKFGIERVMLCVRSSNMASRRVIEANGGLFMDEVPISYDVEPDILRRYIIPIDAVR